ncbi:hypothetical protein [Chryseobacterium koreense]
MEAGLQNRITDFQNGGEFRKKVAEKPERNEGRPNPAKKNAQTKSIPTFRLIFRDGDRMVKSRKKGRKRRFKSSYTEIGNKSL